MKNAIEAIAHAMRQHEGSRAALSEIGGDK